MSLYPEIDRVFGENAAIEIIRCLKDRKGLDYILDDIDEEVMAEIYDEITDAIERELPVIFISDEDDE